MQKCVHLVELVKIFQTSIDLRTSASIQPRTGLSKFAKHVNISQNFKFRKEVRRNIGEAPQHRREGPCSKILGEAAREAASFFGTEEQSPDGRISRVHERNGR